MRQALADSLSLEHPDLPWQLPEKLPPEADIRVGIAALEAAVQPVAPEAAKFILAQLAVTKPKYEQLSELASKLRTETWLKINGDLPQDLWEEAFIAVARDARIKRFPETGEFRATVELKFRRRWEDLKRAREMLTAVVGKKPLPRPEPTKPRPSRAVICKGCIAAYVKMGKIDKAQPYENELAALEGREPRVLERAEAAPPQDSERVVVAKPHETSPEMKARMLRISAANRRSMGMTELAALYDARADALAPRPPDEVRDIAEAAT